MDDGNIKLLLLHSENSLEKRLHTPEPAERFLSAAMSGAEMQLCVTGWPCATWNYAELEV